MSERPQAQKLSDDQVRQILAAPPGADILDLSIELGCCEHTVWHYRARKSKRALRIAKELGIIGGGA